MKPITIHEAKTHLSKYIQQAKSGQKIYIGGFGKAEVVLTRIPIESKVRDFSSLRGLFSNYEEAFTEETEQEIATLMTQ